MDKVDSKKWKVKKEATQEILEKTPNNEHKVYFVDFEKKQVVDTAIIDSEKILDFNETKKKARKKRKTNEKNNA